MSKRSRLTQMKIRSCSGIATKWSGKISRANYFNLFLLLLVLTPAFSSAAQQAAPGNFLDVDGSKLYYQECGTGAEAVVLIHDGVLHSAVWDDVWPAFCKEFHTIRYDRRGYGRSTPATKWYYETDDLVALLQHLKISRAILIGSSHGGEMSIDFTLEHPKLVEQLILVGAVVGGYSYSAHFIERGRQNNLPFEKNDIAAVLQNWSNDRYLTAAKSESARKKMRELLIANPQDFTHPDFPLSPLPALPRLHEIHAPTLILVGDSDIPDVHAHAGAIETSIRNSRRIVVSDTGHLMYLERPEEFSRIVIQFIRGNREPGSPEERRTR